MGSTLDQPLEREVKFLLSDAGSFRKELLGCGAQVISPKTYEKNYRFDTPNQELAAQGKLLRLRQDDGVRLTFKGMPEHETDSEVRIREELEVAVGDFGMLATILERVGFTTIQVYEKYRETFMLGNVEVVIDQMPYGDFVELEGGESDIKRAAARLGLEWKSRILTNYLVLMASVRDFYHLDFDDLTFDNFKNTIVSIADVIRSDRSGRLDDD